MPVDGSLLNAPSGQEMALDLEEKGRRLMRYYVRLRTRLVVQRVTLPEELEQDVVMAYQAVRQADPIGASADYGRKLEQLAPGSFLRSEPALRNPCRGAHSICPPGRSRAP